MKIILKIVLLASISFLVACASNPNKIDASYVSPLKYKDYNCNQLALEMNHVGQRTGKLYQRLKTESDKDSWQMGVGLLLFWPALLFLEGGDGPETAEYAQLKGEFEALRINSTQKECALDIKSPEQILKETDEAEQS